MKRENCNDKLKISLYHLTGNKIKRALEKKKLFLISAKKNTEPKKKPQI